MSPFDHVRLGIHTADRIALEAKGHYIYTYRLNTVRPLEELQLNQGTDIIKGTFGPRQGALSIEERFHRQTKGQ